LTAEVVNLSDSGPDSKWPTVAVNDDGVALAVWSEDFGSGFQLFYTVYKDEHWSSPKSTHLMRENAEIAQVEADQHGNFHLSFSDGNSSRTREIFYAYYNTKNDSWSGRQLVYSSEDNSAWNRTDVEGENVYVMWYHEHGAPYEADIVLNTKKIGDEWQQRYEDVSQDASRTAIHPAFKALHGNIYACYMQNVSAPDSAVWRIYYSERYNGVWIEPFDIGGTHWPAMTAEDTNGLGKPANVHCIFPQKDGHMYIQSRINGKWTGQYPINTTYAEAGFGDIKYKDNTLIAAFAQNSLVGPGASIFLRKRVFKNGAWKAWEDPIEVEEGRIAEYPQLGVDNFGYVHIVWQDDRGNGNNDIYWKKVKVYDAPPYFHVDPDSLSFEAEDFGANPAAQKIKVKNSGTGTLNYTVSADKSWISVSPTSGSYRQRGRRDHSEHRHFQSYGRNPYRKCHLHISQGVQQPEKSRSYSENQSASHL